MKSKVACILLLLTVTQLCKSQILSPLSQSTFEMARSNSLSTLVINEKQEEKKSVLLATLFSLILPGIGEYYAGNFEYGKYQLAAEGALWVGYIGMTSYSSWLIADAHSFAGEHSGAAMRGKDKRFEVNLGNFLSMQEYNEAKLRNREYSLVYTNPEYQWNWDLDENRNKFRSLRIRSDEFRDNAKFLIGGMVLNRLISAFSAGRSAARLNRSDDEEDKWNVSSMIKPDQYGNYRLVLSFSKSF